MPSRHLASGDFNVLTLLLHIRRKTGTDIIMVITKSRGLFREKIIITWQQEPGLPQQQLPNLKPI